MIWVACRQSAEFNARNHRQRRLPLLLRLDVAERARGGNCGQLKSEPPTLGTGLADPLKLGTRAGATPPKRKGPAPEGVPVLR
jgi:hypothetical protein